MSAIGRAINSVRYYVSSPRSTTAISMEKHKIVPDVISVAPKIPAVIRYPCGAEVHIGNELTPSQVKDVPSVKWKAKDTAYYTICMIDPDVPSRKNPQFAEWQHWLVVNIPGGDLCKGETFSEYIGAAPPRGSSLHRYIFLIYKQAEIQKFSEPYLNNHSPNNRANFSIRKLSQKYHLGHPVAGNFFQAQWDSYCPVLYKQLGLLED